MNSKCCRIFEEQIKLLLSLPNQEEAKTVLYQALVKSYNQFENQNENQIENQNDYAYVSVSVSDSISDSESLSELSKSILNLLSKNITWKNFSNNYGGKREGSGRKNREIEQPIAKPRENHKVKKQENENVKPIVDRLKSIIEKYKGREVKSSSWSAHIRKMIEEDNLNPEDIIKSLDWYSAHIGEPYIPVILSGESLREKYGKLEEAIRRNTPKQTSWENF